MYIVKVSGKNSLKPFQLRKSREVSDQTSYKNKQKLSRNMANKTTLFGIELSFIKYTGYTCTILQNYNAE